MSASDKESQLPSPPPYHGHSRQRSQFRKVSSVIYNTLSQPRAYIILLILTFTAGYLSHSQVVQPLLSEDIGDLAKHNTFSTRCSDPVPSSATRQTLLDHVHGGVSPWDGFPPPQVGPLLWTDWNKGWDSSAAVFEHLIEKVRPRVIIEVGTFLGASATHMARLTRRMGLQTLIVCIDDFRGWPGYYDQEKSAKMLNGDSMLLFQFMYNVQKANATDSILFLPFSTNTALGGLCSWGVYGDLIEVDAAHDFHSAWMDINNAYKILRPGGVLFGHDYAWDGVRRAVHSFARLNGLRVKLDGKHWVLY
ncbi:uncharacterized protein LOC125193600 [Salvia hispanica]|uniref:uncharacterized protein LOC125193600 n=1 Tax=Salvia hispanica TaxID=49212 RepID=UPI002008FA0C|nr:uncharacterized protein LOC125193600 [Salvia hispanica]